MTNKSHLINFCYLPYLHLNFSIDTIAFSLDSTRLKTLSLFYFSAYLIVYLFYITSSFVLIAKKSYKKQKRLQQYQKVVFICYFC